MRILWFSALLPLVFAQAEFGTSYLGNTRLCAAWKCLNDHLGLQDSLPSRETYTRILRELLPLGPWQDAVDPTLDVCYGERPKAYSNSCPGQALMQCAVEQLIQNCPDENWKKEDACAPLSSFAGIKYMFSQSRYNNIDVNLPKDRRPEWFVRNYFNVKCCDLPPLFNDTLLNRCGFNYIMHYFELKTQTRAPTHTYKVERKPTETGTVLQVVPFNDVQTTMSSNIEDYGEYDPLDCCDMREFIAPSWRSECAFELSWNNKTRLSIKNTTRLDVTTTTETPSLKTKDVKMVPHSCDQNNCVFKALGIVSESGIVDINAFSKLLDNMTDKHPSWLKAKGRVLTSCLSRPINSYDYGCQINNVLACTLDVLSENCPNSITPDPCSRRSNSSHSEVICQISSSKFRPRNRRIFCGLPNLVDNSILPQCGLHSLINLEYVPEPVIKPRKYLSSISCNDSTPSTTCLMDKMGVLNDCKYLDYFKMKDRIRQHSTGVWYPYVNIFTSAFFNVPHYEQYCSSPKKFLNVVDAMLKYCPASKRQNTPQCNKLFSDITSDIINDRPQNVQLFNTFGHILGNQLEIETQPKTWTHSNPLFDFGLFGSGNAPPVRTIDLRVKTEKPLVLLPVYQRPTYKDPYLRGGPVKV